MNLLTDFDEENLSVVQGSYRANATPSPPGAELQAVRDTCAVINELLACNRKRIDKLTKKNGRAPDCLAPQGAGGGSGQRPAAARA